MPHPSVIRAALTAGLTTLAALLLAVLPAVAPSFAGRTAKAADADPLTVHLDTITPVAPQEGTVDISGTVTNNSTEQWTRINLLAFGSELPIIDTPALAASAETDEEAFVGPRVTEAGTFDTVDVLEPGQTASFSLSVPVELLGFAEAAGVYWVGVHAIGDSSVPRDEFADGRARTFIPSVPPTRESLETAIVLPLRQAVWYQPDGQIAGVQRWTRSLSDGGRLDAVLDTAEAAGSTPYTWLVDPAVLSAVSTLAAGNPPRSLAPDPTVPGQEPTQTQAPEPGSESPSPGAPATTTAPPVPEDELSEEERALADLAAAWLTRMRPLMSSRAVLALPFGDIDVSAAVRHAPARLGQAVARGAAVMSALGVAAQPVVAPEHDVLSPEALAAVAPDTVVLLGDTAFAVPPQTKNSVVRLLGHRVVVTSTGAESGGPAPTRADDPLALRQRILSEAALRLQSSSTAPLVVTLPTGWRPEQPAEFFAQLEQRWLTAVSVPEVADRSAAGVPARALAYTDEDLEAELNATNFATAQQLMDAATLLEKVLTLQTTVEAQVLDSALASLSQQHRGKPRAAVRSTQKVRDGVLATLDEVAIEAPPAVTLSSNTGPFGVTLVNELEEPVTVRVDGTSDGDLTVRGDSVRQLAPGSRSQLRLEATATQPGLHRVRLMLSTEDGTPIGSAVEIPIRAAQVSQLIWYVMAGAAGLLFGAIGLRLWRQVRGRRTDPDGERPGVEEAAR